MQIIYLYLDSLSGRAFGVFGPNTYWTTIQIVCINIPIVKVSLFSELAMSVIKTKNSEKYGFRGKFYSWIGTRCVHILSCAIETFAQNTQNRINIEYRKIEKNIYFLKIETTRTNLYGFRRKNIWASCGPLADRVLTRRNQRVKENCKGFINGPFFEANNRTHWQHRHISI